MALSPEEKRLICGEINKLASSATSLVLADVSGVNAVDMTELRRQARENDVAMRVVKNTLARRAVAGTEYECINDMLIGPTLMSFSLQEPGAAPRLFKEFAGKFKALEVKGIALNGSALPAAELNRLAMLPTREQALAQLAGLLKAPIRRLAATLNDVPGKLVRQVAAIRNQKKEQAG